MSFFADSLLLQHGRMDWRGSRKAISPTVNYCGIGRGGLLHGQKMAVGDPVCVSQTGRRRKDQMQMDLTTENTPWDYPALNFHITRKKTEGAKMAGSWPSRFGAELGLTSDLPTLTGSLAAYLPPRPVPKTPPDSKSLLVKSMLQEDTLC
ncbi:uncharacterized protein LOC118893548 isoform X2 [Balaenoptera musculus]|uniref:Uncharacterized protein LOC118893548 isoform X2 n=1 Tax=Balaenoptera musculus TaxID=9771 RepID=A0A8B8X6I7_BALMU|nr:uncharacterized protein LOC118893548 isoform X2 [Balaenoptera musculus]